MSETVKLWLLTMLEGELKNVDSDISNNRLWQKGCSDDETIMMYEQNITDLEEYKEVLSQMRGQIEEGKLNI